jgi:glycosyltransferase involved in cell wall biosynthesis
VRAEGAHGNNVRVPETPERLRVALLDSIPVWGGGQKWMLTTAQALTGRGHFAAIACAAGSVLEQRAREARLPLWTAPVGRFGWRFGSSLSLARFLRAQRVECVIGNVGRDLRLGVLACGLSGAKLLQRRGILRPVRGDPWNRWLYGRAVRRVIVDSEALRAHIVESAPYLGDRVVLLPNAIDTSKPLGGDGAKLRAELGIAPEAPLVGTVGRLAPMKGFEHLLRAWPHVVERHPTARLVVFGGGELESALREEAAHLGVARSVVLAGFRPDPENLYQALDVFVLPSVKHETVSNAVLEAMAHGKPVVVTDYAGGIAEPVNARGAGCVVPVGDARALGATLAALLADPAARERMGRAARETIEAEHSLERSMRMLEELLRSVRDERAISAHVHR